MLFPIDIDSEVSDLLKVKEKDRTQFYQMVLSLYRKVLMEIARRESPDPGSLAISALTAEIDRRVLENGEKKF